MVCSGSEFQACSYHIGKMGCGSGMRLSWRLVGGMKGSEMGRCKESLFQGHSLLS